MTIQIGDKTTWQRTFTEQDVTLFCELSGDKGIHHLERDAEGRLMVHGLLTATIPTKLGGDMNFIAREITYLFLRPVFTGDMISCENVLTHYEHTEKYYKVACRFTCTNQHGKEVLNGHVQGVILHT